MLKHFAEILLRYCDDNIIAYRKSGDEFIFQTQGLTYEEVVSFLTKINNDFSNALFFDRCLSCSIGFVEYDKNIFTNPMDTVKLADIAMYEAKETGKGKYKYLTKAECTQILKENRADEIIKKYNKNRKRIVKVDI